MIIKIVFANDKGITIMHGINEVRKSSKGQQDSCGNQKNEIQVRNPDKETDQTTKKIR